MNNSAYYSPPGYRLLAKELSKSFGHRSVFSGISFEAQTGDKVAIQGPNGSGKTTLIKVLGKMLRPTSGQVEVSALSEYDDQGGLSITGPWLTPYLPLTLMENIQFVQKARGCETGGEEIAMLLRRLGLANEASLRPLSQFSSGMLQKARIAIAFSVQAPVLMLDEPTEYLDATGRDAVRDLMRGFRKEGILIVASNDTCDLDGANLTVDFGGAA